MLDMPWQRAYNFTHSRDIVDIHEYYTDAAHKLHIAAQSGSHRRQQSLRWRPISPRYPNAGNRALAEIAPALRTGARGLSSQNKSRLLNEHETNNDLNTPLLGQTMQNANDLGADDIFSPLDERIIAAASEAMEAGETHYVDVPGIAPLRAAVADFLNDSTGAAYQSGNIIVTAGAQESRFLTIQKIGELYDSIAVPAVVHPGVRKALGVRQRNVVSLPVDDARGHLPTVSGIADAVAAGCRLLVLESPSRLTGAAYSADEVEAIGKILSENDAAAIWDQGLAVWVDGGCSSLAAQEDAPTRIATIGESWPGQGLASWFIAYIAAPEAWVPSMQSQKQIMAICTATASQYAALEAGGLFAEAQARQSAQLIRQRADLLELARKHNLGICAGDASNIIALRLSEAAVGAVARLRKAGFDAADGELFGAPDVIRLTVSSATAAALEALC